MKTEWQYTKKKNNHRFHIEVELQPAIGLGFAAGYLRKDYVLNIFFICVTILIEIR